jgi:hypothetical protein
MPYKDPKIRKKKAKEYSKKWYEKNKKGHRLNSTKNKKKYKKAWDIFKASQKCFYCSVQHPAVIDFHHVIRTSPKVSVHTLIKNKSYAKAMEEVKKCIPLCANCHRILHWVERIIEKTS